ncbi:hypothetical protein CCHL11_06096 [Colletotrichum chlorophyti]|uniref:Uncharacterized protein n=1 Tax=Colletotrichum chlorophyti TaxID=708187 RepID=A0A1Q8RT22_9PEZI|nr:hypothetical protein CCHL11_06096 [Colletotrichum chlorophyti]
MDVTQVDTRIKVKTQCERFDSMPGIKRIISSGGLTFSTHFNTYEILRNPVKYQNRNISSA